MIAYELGRWHTGVIFATDGSLLPRGLAFAVPSALLAWLIRFLFNRYDWFLEDYGVDPSTGSQAWGALTGIIIMLLAFRTARAFGRFWEGTTLLHQLRAEWFDAVSSLVAFTRTAEKAKPEEVRQFHYTIIRVMSLMHGSALYQVKELGNEEFEVLDARGLDHQSLSYLLYCGQEGINRVEVLLHWFQAIISDALCEGVIDVPPPILTRVFQELSRGMVNLHNAKKITDTPFPIPYAQIITWLLLLNLLLTPFVVASYISNPLWAALITFIPILGMSTTNFIAGELEHPFGDASNDLPLHTLQADMNRSLMMLLDSRTQRAPKLKSSAVTDFKELQKIITEPIKVSEAGIPEVQRQNTRMSTLMPTEVNVDKWFSNRMTRIHRRQIPLRQVQSEPRWPSSFCAIFRPSTLRESLGGIEEDDPMPRELEAGRSGSIISETSSGPPDTVSAPDGASSGRSSMCVHSMSVLGKSDPISHRPSALGTPAHALSETSLPVSVDNQTAKARSLRGGLSPGLVSILPSAACQEAVLEHSENHSINSSIQAMGRSPAADVTERRAGTSDANQWQFPGRPDHIASDESEQVQTVGPSEVAALPIY